MTDSERSDIHLPGVEATELQFGNLIRTVSVEEPTGRYSIQAVVAAVNEDAFAAAMLRLMLWAQGVGGDVE